MITGTRTWFSASAPGGGGAPARAGVAVARVRRAAIRSASE